MPSRIRLGHGDLFPSLIEQPLAEPSVESPRAQDRRNPQARIATITQKDMPQFFRPFFDPTDVILFKWPSSGQRPNWISDYRTRQHRRSPLEQERILNKALDQMARQGGPNFDEIAKRLNIPTDGGSADIEAVLNGLANEFERRRSPDTSLPLLWPGLQLGLRLGAYGLAALFCPLILTLLARRNLGEFLGHLFTVLFAGLVVTVIAFLILVCIFWEDVLVTFVILRTPQRMYSGMRSFYALYKDITNPANIPWYLLRNGELGEPISNTEALQRFNALSEDGCCIAILSPYPALVASPLGRDTAGSFIRWLNTVYWAYRAWQRVNMILPMFSDLAINN